MRQIYQASCVSNRSDINETRKSAMFLARSWSLLRAGGRLVARTAASLQDRAARSPKEYLGVLNTARSHTHFLASPRMARVLGRSTFDPA